MDSKEITYGDKKNNKDVRKGVSISGYVSVPSIGPKDWNLVISLGRPKSNGVKT